jgi:hypothetical protein
MLRCTLVRATGRSPQRRIIYVIPFGYVTRSAPEAEAVGALAGLGIRYILVHIDRMSYEALKHWTRELAEANLHQMAHVLDGVVIFKVLPTIQGCEK